MATEVVLTGTGYPRADPNRAGPGLFVRTGDLVLQFDCGRATTMRLAAAGVAREDVTAVFVTHHHSDHLVGLTDLVLTRWIEGGQVDRPLDVIAPAGPSVRTVERLLDPWADDIEVRRNHFGSGDRPRLVPRAFGADVEPAPVWESDGVTVSAFLVEHMPVEPAVGYRVDTPDGSIVISGDTRVCDAVARASVGADVLVHEAMLRAPGNPVAPYHAECVELGAQAAETAVPALVLTHLIPRTASPDDFERDVRDGGYGGRLIVGADLDRLSL